MTWEECRPLCEAEAEGEWKADLAVFDTAEELEEFSITWLEECECCEYFSDPRRKCVISKLIDKTKLYFYASLSLLLSLAPNFLGVRSFI